MKLFATLTLMCLVMAGQTAKAQRNFDDVKIKATHVAGNVHMLEGSGGNIGVSIGPDGMLIVDDQFAPLAEKIEKALQGLGDGKLKFVLNTHWHGDHVGGNAHFGRKATIIAHQNVRKRLASKQMLFDRETGPLPKEALPVITFDESLTIHFNDEEIKVIHYPHGHTDGDSVIFFTKSNVVHLADLFFNGMFPFVDIDHGGSVQGLIHNIERIITQMPADVKVIPGHGPLATLADLKDYHGMLIETTGIVRAGLASGKTVEELQEAGLPEKFKPISDGFIKTEKWIETIAKSLELGNPE